MKAQKPSESVIDPRILELIVRDMPFSQQEAIKKRNAGTDDRRSDITVVVLAIILCLTFAYFGPSEAKLALCLFAALFFLSYFLMEKIEKGYDKQWQELLDDKQNEFQRKLRLELVGNRVEDMVSEVMAELAILADQKVSVEERLAAHRQQLSELSAPHSIVSCVLDPRLQELFKPLGISIDQDGECIRSLQAQIRYIINHADELLGHHFGFNAETYRNIFAGAKARGAVKAQNAKMLVKSIG